MSTKIGRILREYGLGPNNPRFFAHSGTNNEDATVESSSHEYEGRCFVGKVYANGKVEVIYDPDRLNLSVLGDGIHEGQLQEATRFRKYLEERGIDYTEVPSRDEVVSRIKASFE